MSEDIKLPMRKDLRLLVLRDSLNDENILLKSPDGRNIWQYKQNILTEDGLCVSWHFHPYFKKLTFVYFDEENGRLWLPKAKLYDKRKLKKVMEHLNWAFFRYGYARAIVDGTEVQSTRMSGWLPEGESLF